MTRCFTDAAAAAAPDRNDAVIARPIQVPAPVGANQIPAVQVQIPLVPAANPAAIAPNRVVVMSGLSHSSQRKRRTLDELGGGGGCTAAAVQERNPEAIFATFSEMQRIQNLTAANANIMSILSGVANIPDSDDKTSLQTVCIQSLRANTAAMSSPQQRIRDPLPSLPVPIQCTICHEILKVNEQRQVYVDCVFTPCGHGFHINCLESWKTSRSVGSTQCPVCREPL